MLASCGNTSANYHVAGPLRRTECYRGIPGGPQRYGVAKSVWVIFQIANLLSVAAYGYHAGLAYWVLRGINKKKAAGIVEVEDPEVVAARRTKAREEWIKMTRHGL